MAQSFSLSSERCAVISDPALRAEIHARTESDEETSRILRSIDRFGTDPSIQRFEMAPQTVRGGVHSRGGVAWTVKAVRREVPAES